jgi:L-iditol 2-dehydrogenase
MLSFSYDGPGKLALRETEVPKASETSAVIKVNATSICGTDLRTYRFGSSKIHGLPRIIGHEAVGTIVEKGGRVKGFEVGDRVQIAPAIGCGHCPSCKKERPISATTSSPSALTLAEPSRSTWSFRPKPSSRTT